MTDLGAPRANINNATNQYTILFMNSKKIGKYLHWTQ